MSKITKSSPVFQFNGLVASLEEDGTMCLNTLYTMAGQPENKDPYKWGRQDSTKELKNQILSETEFQVNGILKPILLKTKRGKGGGTYAHWKLALEYAGYLSPALRSQYYEWIKDRIEEDNDPELGITRSRDRAIAKWKSQGKSDKWINVRLQGINVRHKFTDTLSDYGINQSFHFGIITNNLTKATLGKLPEEIKEQNKIASYKSSREAMSPVELAAILLAETMATETIENNNFSGFNQCNYASEEAGKKVNRVFA